MLNCWDAAISPSQQKITGSATHFTKLIANMNQRASVPTNPVLEHVLAFDFSHRTCPGRAEVTLPSFLSLLLPSSLDTHYPESKEVQQPHSSDEAGIHVWGINTLLRGTLEWSVPNPSHNCCTDLSSPCWCKTLMQPGPAIGSYTCWPGGPAARDQMELGRAAKGQQWLTGCPAVVALCCTLWFGHSLGQLSSHCKTQAPGDIAEPESVCNRGYAKRKRFEDEGRFYPYR